MSVAFSAVPNEWDAIARAGHLGEPSARAAHEGNGQSWAAPEPLRAPLPAPEAYPVAALGELLGAAVVALQETVRAPLALCAQSALAASAYSVQAHFDAQMPWGETKPVSLAMLTVAESGERKSGADNLVLRAAKVQEREEMAAFESEKEASEVALMAWKNANEHARKQASGKARGTLADFRQAAEEIGPPPSPPLLPLRFVSDPTVEGLYKLLAIGQPSVAVFSDEGALLIGGHAMNRDNALKTLARFCKLWDGAPYDRVRGEDGSGILYGRRMALHLLAQPEVMTMLLGDAMANGQGFLARCLVAWPASHIGTSKRLIERYELGEERPALQRLFATLKGFLDTAPRTHDARGQVLNPIPLALTAEAEQIAIAASNRFELRMAKGEPWCEIRDRAAKALDNAIRLAAILTVVEQGLTAHEIGAAALDRGLILMQWYLGEALRIRGAAAIPRTVSDAEALVEWLKGRGLRMFRSRQVLNAGPAQLRNKARFLGAVAELVNNGYAVENPPGTWVDGVKTRRSWLLHPEIA